MRPEHLALALNGAKADLTAAISHVEQLGAETHVYLDAGLDALIALRIAGQGAPSIGERVGIVLDRTRLLRFGADGRSLK